MRGHIQYITTSQLAQVLGVSAKTIRNLTEQGMPCLKVSDRIWRYHVSACINFLNATGGIDPVGTKEEPQEQDNQVVEVEAS